MKFRWPWPKTPPPGPDAPRPKSLGGPQPLGGHSGKAPADPDAKPPKTRGTLPSLVELRPSSRVLHQELERQLSGLEAPTTDPLPERGTGDEPTPLHGTPVPTHLRVDRAPRLYQKDSVWIGVARQVASLGTCCRLKVGAVLLTKQGRVAGIGYNGAGPGMPHCHPDTCNDKCRCQRTVHAEVNALFNKSGDPHTAYVTAEPCLNCTKDLALAGVRRVVYLNPYKSIAPEERAARAEWIDHYRIAWEQFKEPA